MKFLQTLILIIILHIIKSKIEVNVTFTQIENANCKISLTCFYIKENENEEDCTSYAGTAILSYYYESNTKKSQIRLNHISLSNNQSIERNIYIPVHDLDLNFTSFKIGNKKVDSFKVNENNIFKVEMPIINDVNVEVNPKINNGPVHLIIKCSNCKDSIFIPERTEIPDDTFYLSNGSEFIKTYLRSCTPMNELKSNESSINITCIPFSPGTNIEYSEIHISTNKIGFIKINDIKVNIPNVLKFSYTECESLITGSPIYYNVNKVKNPTFTLTSKKKIDINSLKLLSNDTYIHNQISDSTDDKISVCQLIEDEYTLECGIDFIHFPHLKQDDEDVSVYYIYEEKDCGKALTGAVILASNSFYIKNVIWYFLLFCFFMF